MTRRATKAEVRMGHKGPAIVWPFDPADVWGEWARYFVKGTMNGVAFEGEIGRRRGVFYTCVPDDLLRAAGVVPDATVDLVVEERERGPDDPVKPPPLVWARRT